MGYTHYWDMDRRPTADEWEAITSDFKHLLDVAPTWGLLTGTEIPPLKGERDNSNPNHNPIDNEREVIIFNGVGAAGHETMVIGPGDALGFQFCKTARKPYDLWVTALLILCHYHAPNCWRIGSDGTVKEWWPALTLVNYLHPDAQVPFEE